MWGRKLRLGLPVSATFCRRRTAKVYMVSEEGLPRVVPDQHQPIGSRTTLKVEWAVDTRGIVKLGCPLWRFETPKLL